MSTGSPIIPNEGTPIGRSVRTDTRLQDAERQNWGAVGTGTIRDLNPILDYQPWTGVDGHCAYGAQMEDAYWSELPIDEDILQSHKQWVDNRRSWGGSKYVAESIEPTVDWRGLRLPEPVPQDCSRAELTEYGPADFSVFVTQTRRKCGNPVISPAEMAHTGKLPFSYYGF